MSEDDDHDTLLEGPLAPSEIQALRAIARDYHRARWMRGQLKIWAAWVLGAPVAILGAWQASSTIYNFLMKILVGKVP